MTQRTAVYRLYDQVGALLYVGATNNPDVRWKQHAATKDWWPDVRRKAVAWFATRVDALDEERRAIEMERPQHNRVAGKLTRNAGVTTNRVIRMREEWDELGEAVGPRHRAETVRALVNWWLRKPGAKMPPRPPKPRGPETT